MKFSLFILVTILSLGFLYSASIRGVAYRVFLTDEQTLLKQLNGDGCGYQGSCGTFSISGFSGRQFRNYEMRCRMYAARCLAQRGQHLDDYKLVVESLQNAQKAFPEFYDTGDGIIEYGRCIRCAIKQIRGEEDEGLCFCG